MIDLKDFQLSPEQAAALQARQAAAQSAKLENGSTTKVSGSGPIKQRKFKLQFCQFRPAGLYRIAKDTHNAELAILTRLYELWFTNFKQNPVKLNADWFRELGFDRHYIYQTLARLEKSDQITVERRAGQCPRVTLNGALLW
jgi:hypothetical protein